MVKKREGKRIDTGKKKENGAPIYNWIKNDNKTVDSELTNNINNDFINNDDITSLSDEEVSDYFQDNIEDLGETYYTDSRTQRNFNPYDNIYNKFKNQEKYDLTWNKEERKDLETVITMIDVKNSDKDKKTKQKEISKLQEQLTDYNPPQRHQFPIVYRDGERREVLHALAHYINSDVNSSQRDSKELKELREHNFQGSQRLINAKQTAKDNIEYDNTHYDPQSMWGKNAHNYYDALLEDYINNNRGELELDDDKEYFYDDYDTIYAHTLDDQQLYLTAVFPQKELNNKLEQYGIDNVFVSNFHNGREWGNVYTVMTPNGDAMSFSVYEHRNSDSIIINGKNNWDGEELPYTSDNKYEYFGEYSYQDYDQAADSLAMHLKDAQNGNLPSEEYLRDNAPRIDWVNKLSERIPSFKQWYKQYYPEEVDRYEQAQNNPLEQLDFEPREEL